MHEQQHSTDERNKPKLPARSVSSPQATALSAPTAGGPGRPGPAELRDIQRAAGNRAATATVQRTQQAAAPKDAPSEENAQPVDPLVTRLAESIEKNTLQKKRKFNFWEPHKKWPEKWLWENARLRRVLERRLVLGKPFQEDEVNDIKALSTARPDWLKDIGIGTYAEGEQNAAGLGAKSGTDKGAKKGVTGKATQADNAEEQANYSTWLKLSPGQRILAATIAFREQAPRGGARIPDNPAYTLGRFMNSQSMGTDDPERRKLEAERDEQIRETAVDTLFPEGVSKDHKHSDGESPEAEMKERDAFARTILTNLLLVLQNGLQVGGTDGRHLDYKDGDVIRALAHGGRVNIRIPALSSGEQPHQLLDNLGITKNGVRDKHVVVRDFATHRATIGPNKDDQPGAFKEQGGVGSALKNKLSDFTPGMTNPDLLGVNISGGGLGTKDWNGDVVLPDGSYGHMLLVFTAPTAARDGSLLVGIETVAPHARSPVGYHHGIRSTEATANPESVLHGHKQDKVGSGKMKNNQRLVELKKMEKPGGQRWHEFLETIKKEWAEKLAGAETIEQKRRLYQGLVGRRS
ncbi:PE-PGRS family protein [Streptomyces sp. AC602_WCS936]|uniref:PE-PGRS family protein n=1 Tax=Streptomyces sp. AC602_WCS936 TaxID=2823685 RepID=UPI0020B64233|nr:PE-PGRS family protein [Streptomyces sp. AC602_WCS936]